MNEEELFYTLRLSPLFSALSDVLLEQLTKEASFKSYRKGELIIGQSGNDYNVGLLLRGKVRVKLYFLAGKELLVDDLKPGALFGDFAAIDRQPRSASVFAMQNSLVLEVPGPTFVSWVTENPAVAKTYQESMTLRMRKTMDKLGRLYSLSAAQRIQAVLVDLSGVEPAVAREAQQLKISDLPTQSELAARAFTQREVVAREISRLESEGKLERQENQWTLFPEKGIEYLSLVGQGIG